MKELEGFHKERCLDFKPPKFYGEPLNLLKLFRSVVRLGGYEYVTSCKTWRTIGEAFKPPKTCTTVSWTFRVYYEKSLLEYERYKMSCGELPYTDSSSLEPASAAKQQVKVLMMELVDVYKIRLPKFTVKVALQYMHRVIQKKAKFDIMDINVLKEASEFQNGSKSILFK